MDLRRAIKNLLFCYLGSEISCAEGVTDKDKSRERESEINRERERETDKDKSIERETWKLSRYSENKKKEEY